MRLTVSEGGREPRIHEAPEGLTVLEALQQAGCAVYAPCGGAGTCGRCEVLVRDERGSHHVLACRTPARDGMEAVLGGASMVVEGAPAEGDAASPNGRACDHARTHAEPSPSDRAGGNPSRAGAGPWGLAVDLGTTTLAFHLVDLSTGAVVAAKGSVNPQVSYGADVIARIRAARDPGRLFALCGMLRASLDDARRELARVAGIAVEDVREMAVAGNTVMEHFACGLDPAGIGAAPFTPASLFGAEMPLYAGPGDARLTAYLAPAVAGYVGGDITAGLLHARTLRKSTLQLFVDIGTNGEMALGDREGALCCATAAGPAFEGSGIAFGMPAMAGAICAVDWDGTRLTASTVHGGAPTGICGSGLIDAVACLLDAGIVDETGRMTAPDPSHPLAGRVRECGGERMCLLDDEGRVHLTQGDVRQVQMAKAALRRASRRCSPSAARAPPRWPWRAASA